MDDSKTTYLIRLGNLLFFMVLLVFWRFFYVNHLLQKEQLQLFLVNFGYFREHLSYPGGLSIYLSEFICQFFLNPWVAATAISILLLAFAWLTQKIMACNTQSQFVPLAYLPAIGYSLVLLNSYYPLSGLVAVLIACTSVLIYLKITKAPLRFLTGFILLLLTYWISGAAYMLFALTIIIAELRIKTNRNKHRRVTIGILAAYTGVAVFFPFLCKQFFLTDNLQESYLSRAFYKISLLFPAPLLIVILSVPVFAFYYSFMHERIKSNIHYVLNTFFSLVAVTGLLAGLYLLPNREEEKEMHFDNLVASQQWDGIISLAENNAPTGPQGKLALSLALAKTGQMSTKLFNFNLNPSDFFIPFTLKGMAPLIANEPYFYLGFINFSKMMSYESIQSTPDEKMPVRAVKRFAENCIITGQYAIAERYIWYLEHTIFYCRWANEARQYLYDDEKVNAHPVWGALRRQQPKDQFYLQYYKMELALVTILRSDHQNKMAYEYLMSDYLLRKDFDRFLKYLPLLKSVGYSNIPKTFQEALAYIKTLVKDNTGGLDQYPISPQVQQNLMRYAQAFKKGGNKKPEEMKKQFGNTYWYYLHFTKLDDE